MVSEGKVPYPIQIDACSQSVLGAAVILLKRNWIIIHISQQPVIISAFFVTNTDFFHFPIDK